ncbi:MAG: type II toxin-antitoxin system HicA family toxin [Synechococcaceae cyanobacterium]
MRIPRDLNGADLAKRLGQFGYTITRQSGSHMRLTRIDVGREQHLTIPAHKPCVSAHSGRPSTMLPITPTKHWRLSWRHLADHAASVG